MQTEKHYEFRKRMLEIHKRNLRNTEINCAPDEFEFSNGCRIVIPEDADIVTETAAKDFADYLFVSMNVSAQVARGNALPGDVSLKTDSTAFSQRGYRIEVSDKVAVSAYDGWSASQALYYLEDLMTVRKAPYISKVNTERIMRFSPRMLHSGFGLDEYPDGHLSMIAHSGRDAILVFAEDVDKTPYGYLDFNDLIYRASRYGIDVYAYSYLSITMHPEAKGAEEAYDAVYGKLFKNCPGLKGITLVGESVEFESKDEHVGKCGARPLTELPTGKPRPGWWPCYDFPQWLNLVKNTVRKYKPDADVVFWTYNWGWVEEKYRISLIESLPTDISLLATFEMFETFKRDGITYNCSDYTISFEGPGGYFASEAEAAAKKGIRLYSMTNTGGLTWDMGVIPYVPVPYQWQKRYDKMKEYSEKCGLCGIMESHHYGFYPSFIGDFSSRFFDIGAGSAEEELTFAISKHFGSEAVDTIKEALKKWSEAIAYHSASNEDQYGPWRVGPAYPFVLKRKMTVPCDEQALFGSRICFTDYPDFPTNDHPINSAAALRIPREIEYAKKEKELFEDGVRILESISKPNEELLRLINLGKFMACIVTTGINIKKWYMQRAALKLAADADEGNEILDNLTKIAYDETENAKKAIPLVEFDSRLGWEPSMEYVCHRENIEWKIDHLNYVINSEITDIRDSFNR